MSSKKSVGIDGTIRWKNAEGQRHREDGPAVICPSGREYWYLNDKCFWTPDQMPLKLYIQYIKWNRNHLNPLGK
jgi:hypothetical protein